MKKLQDYTIAEIHAKALIVKTSRAMCEYFDLDRYTFHKYLAKFVYKGYPLTVAMLNALTVEKALIFFGAENYYKPMIAPANTLSEYNFRFIHDCVLRASNPTNAAAFLGKSSMELNDYLRKIELNGQGLTFTTFKNITVEKAETIWGRKYNKPMKVALSGPDHRNTMNVPLTAPLTVPSVVLTPMALPVDHSLMNDSVQSEVCEYDPNTAKRSYSGMIDNGSSMGAPADVEATFFPSFDSLEDNEDAFFNSLMPSTKKFHMAGQDENLCSQSGDFSLNRNGFFAQNISNLDKESGSLDWDPGLSSLID